jgi:hypothetical protein
MIAVKRPRALIILGAALGLLLLIVPVLARHRMNDQSDAQTQNHPWMDSSLQPDQRADMLL